MKNVYWTVIVGVCLLTTIPAVSLAQAPILLYNQDFENPTGFVNDGGDINIFRTINQNFGDQPTGFQFAQANTVETLFVNGTDAYGTGYSDPSGIGGDYTLGMLSSSENDLLGLSFDVGEFDFLVLQMDVSSIDLDRFGGPFVPLGAVPSFEFSLFDNPGGGVGLGSGTLLATGQAMGAASAKDTFEWTPVAIPLDSSAATNGNVILRIDLLDGGYAAVDNFRIFASETTSVPEPATSVLLATTGLLALLCRRRA